MQSTTWVDARGDVHTASGQNQVKQLIGSVGLFGVVTELTVSTRPLIKMKAQTYRIMHQEQMLSQLDALMSEPSTAVIQWVPDRCVFPPLSPSFPYPPFLPTLAYNPLPFFSHCTSADMRTTTIATTTYSRQAFVTSRWEVPPDTWGTAQFSVFNNKPLISRLAGPTIGLQQVDNAQLNPFDWRAGTRLLDDLPICLASAVLLPFYQLKPHPFTQVPVLTEALTHPVVGRVSDMACSNCAPNDRGCVWRGAYTTLLELDFDASRLREWMGDVQKIYDAGVSSVMAAPLLTSLISTYWLLPTHRVLDWIMAAPHPSAPVC